MQSKVAKLPLFVRKFIVDFIETSVGVYLGLNLIFPADVASAKQVGITIGVATLGAFVSALRRSAPDFIGWVKNKLGVTNAGGAS